MAPDADRQEEESFMEISDKLTPHAWKGPMKRSSNHRRALSQDFRNGM